MNGISQPKLFPAVSDRRGTRNRANTTYANVFVEAGKSRGGKMGFQNMESDCQIRMREEARSRQRKDLGRQKYPFERLAIRAEMAGGCIGQQFNRNHGDDCINQS
jgi:hypothetical protein